jgi:serine phosphatase RsbU (regulator of sigma subunit)
LAALNDHFTLTPQLPGAPLRLTTGVTATFDRSTGEFNYAYAGHPRMLLWRVREGRWYALGEGLEGLRLGVIAGEAYSQQSVRLEPGDIVLAFSDAVTEVKSPDGKQLATKVFLELAQVALARLPPPLSLHDLAGTLLEAIARYHGSEEFEDDLTLLTLRRSA